MKRLVFRLISLTAVALYFTGCSDSDSSETRSDGFECGPIVTGEIISLELCDITTPECQCNVYKWVSVQRGSELFTPPPTNSITREDYQASLDDRGDGTGDEEVDAFGEVLRLVGYNNSEQTFSDDESDTRGSGVAAFYSTQSEQVTVITDEGSSSSNTRAVTLLAHEYAHAQQDTEEYFDYLNARILDADMLLTARTSLEGEAELIESFAGLELANLPRDEWDWKQANDELEELIVGRSLEQDNPYPYANLVFPYPYGAEMFASSYFGLTGLDRSCLFAQDANDASDLVNEMAEHSEALRASALTSLKAIDQFGGDYRDVREQRCAFPTQSKQLLLEQYGRDARADGYADQIQPTFEEPELPDGLAVAQGFRPMGAWHYFLYLQFAFPDEFDSDSAQEAVDQLRGDRLYTVKDEDGDTLFGGWWFHMVDADAADALSEVLIENPDESSEQWSVFVDGPHVVLAVGQEVNEAWRTWMNDLPAEYEQFLTENAVSGTKSTTPPIHDRPQLPVRIY